MNIICIFHMWRYMIFRPTVCILLILKEDCSGNLTTKLLLGGMWSHFQHVVVQKMRTAMTYVFHRLFYAEKSYLQKTDCVEWLNWNQQVNRKENRKD